MRGLVDHLNGVVNRTVSDSRLTAIHRPETDRWVITRLVDRVTAPLELGGQMRLWVQQETHVNQESRRCETVTYQYRLDRRGKWMIRWEFFRSRPRDDYDYPLAHLHVNTRSPKCPTKDFDHLHIPTRRVPLELILWHAITEWEVPPKPGWQDTLSASIDGFEERQTVR